nr:hypothetical protein [Tanacetum cinerariifolium]
MKESEVQAIKEIEKWLKESELQQQESLITKGTTLEANLNTDGTTLNASLVIEGTSLEACLVTEGAVTKARFVTKGAALEACLVNEGITLNDNMGVTKRNGTESESSSLVTSFSRSKDENKSSNKDSSSSMNECIKLGNENESSDHESTSLGNDANADVGPSYDNDTVTKVPHSSNDTFKNMFAHGIQSHEQTESIPDIYEVNETNCNIIFDIPNMDPDKDKEKHDNVAHDQQSAFIASLIYNLKCDVEKCNEVNREAEQANALLTNELERYKQKENHFAKDMIIKSEYCKKVKLLNDEISNLKSQACEKDKTFAKKNEKYDEYVKPLLKWKNELEKKNKELLKQINDLDNRI